MARSRPTVAELVSRQRQSLISQMRRKSTTSPGGEDLALLTRSLARADRTRPTGAVGQRAGSAATQSGTKRALVDRRRGFHFSSATGCALRKVPIEPQIRVPVSQIRLVEPSLHLDVARESVPDACGTLSIPVLSPGSAAVLPQPSANHPHWKTPPTS